MSPSTPARLHPVPEPAGPVRWEPCLWARPDETGTGACATCGWLVEDHGPDQSLLTPRAA